MTYSPREHVGGDRKPFLKCQHGEGNLGLWVRRDFPSRVREAGSGPSSSRSVLDQLPNKIRAPPETMKTHMSGRDLASP